MRRRLRTVLRIAAVVLVVVLVTTWVVRMQRCREELATQRAVDAAAVRAQVPERSPAFRLVVDAHVRVGRYCDAPIWEWWR